MKRKSMRRRAPRLLSVLLALCMVLALLPGTALAAETSGKCGDNVTWTLNADGTLIISGTGYMDDWNTYPLDENGNSIRGWEPPWEDYDRDIKIVKIGEGVTSIGERAFEACRNLTSVTIPDSVTSIGNKAFYNCASLTSITIPSGMTTIETDTFRECGSLESVDIPEGVTTIRASAFYGCGSLSSATIPEGVTAIEGAVFYNCTGLTSVTIPGSVTSIGMEAFSYCKNLTDVYYGGSREQWARIDVGSSRYNAQLLGANIHYSDEGAAPSTSDSRSALSVTVNGLSVMWTGAVPFIDKNDRTMVPLRAVADAMGLEVNWDAGEREAVFTDGGKTIYFPIDDTAARTSDGETVQMDTAAAIVSDRTYAPIRYLAEFFGYTVGWDAEMQTVTIN